MWLIIYYFFVLLDAWMQPISVPPVRTRRSPMGLIEGSSGHQESQQFVDQAAAGSLSINGVHCPRKARSNCQSPNTEMNYV